MAILYIAAGCFHFIKPKIYLRIMPRYLPNPKLLVYLSGALEILLGIGIWIPSLKTISIYTIISMLMVFLLVHFYMLSSKKASAGIPFWLLLLRIPVQFALMYWAFYYLKL
tara:strand:+ start:4119 stop:4451 length:333 start_codon:yes stop_codon:yes gene_type:complete